MSAPSKEVWSKFKDIFKKNFIVGLDIGSSSLKIAVFAKKENGLRLIRTDLREIKPVTDLVSRQKEIIALLKDLLKGIDFKKSKFIVSVNCSKTAIRKISAPCMPRSELVAGLKLEAKNYFLFPIGQAQLDFEITGEIIEKGVKKFKLLIATSPQETVNGYLSLLEKVGIKPSAFVPTPYALEKLAESFSPLENKIQCLIDIGSSFTELVILKGKNLIFSRKILIAGDEFTKAMTGVLVSDKGRVELTLVEAENIKCQIGIPVKGEAASDSHLAIGGANSQNRAISTTQILSLLISPLEQLVNEIDRCFDYYREEADGGKIDVVTLLGSGSSLIGLGEFLSLRLGLDVKLGYPDFPDSQRFASVIGAALSSAKGINLLPLEIKEKNKRTFRRSGVEVMVVGITLGLALFYIGLRIQLSNFEKKIFAAKRELSSLTFQFKQAAILGELTKEPYWTDVFKELSNIIPSNIYLTELSMENNLIRMRGIVNSQVPEEFLSNFMLILENGLFKDVKLIAIKKIAEKPANEFEIICAL